MADENPTQDVEEQISEQPADTPAPEQVPQEQVPQEQVPQEQMEQPAPQEQQNEAEKAPAPKQEEESQPSRRENLRIQQLVSKLRQQQPEGPSQPQQAPEVPDALNYSEKLNADEETLKTLESDRRNYGDTQYNRGLSEAQRIANTNIFHTRLEIDAPKVASKYSFLNKDSDDFHPVMANAVNEWYLASAGYDSDTGSVRNPDVRYAEFVDGIFELADEIAQQKVSTSRKNIAQQAAKTGIRPDGSPAQKMDLSKAPSEMTTEELTAFINQNLPRQ